MPVALAILATLLKYRLDVLDGFRTVIRRLCFLSSATIADESSQLNDLPSAPLETWSEIYELDAETVRQPEYLSEDQQEPTSFETPPNTSAVPSMQLPVA